MQMQGNKKLILIIGSVAGIMLLLLVAGIYMVLTKPKAKQTSSKKNTSSQTTTTQNNNTSDTPQPAPTTPSPTPANPSGGTAPPPAPPAKKPWFKLILDHASQSGKQIEILARVEGTAAGTCDLTLSRAGMPTFKQSIDMRTDEFHLTTCGFVINSDSIYSTGKWNVSMVAKVGDVTSDPITTTIDITH